MSFYFWNKIKVCTPGCPGVIYLRWCWQNMWSRWLTDWYDSLAICICPLFVFVLKFVLVFVGGKTREEEQMGSSCHSTAARLIKLSANAPTHPPMPYYPPPLFLSARVNAFFLLRELWGAAWPIMTNCACFLLHLQWTSNVLKIKIWLDFD